VELARGGRALLPIVAAPEARAAADELAGMLQRITGASFERSDTVPLASRSISLTLSPELSGEAYVLATHPAGLRLTGATPRAIEHAVWDLLHRVGYRQFFPGEIWEVVPKIEALSIAIDARESPSYESRRIWFGHGPWGYNVAPFADWQKKNRLGGNVVLSTGHAYAKIIRKNQSAFHAHPEYLGLIGGERKSTKLCVSNPGLRSLVVEYAKKHFRDDPAADSVALDPSDGGGWCECEQCRKLGPITDRAVLLANTVAGEVGGKLVGMYAYNQHAPPPSIRVAPNVVVNVATAYLTGGATVEGLLEGWKRQGARVGIREYFSVNAWDRDLPGRARASSTEYIATSISRFHSLGARYFSAESGDNWGPCGLGYYLASRILWDVREGARVEALREDFLSRAFGPAKAPMDAFYAAIDGKNEPLLSDDLIARLYGSLAEARKLVTGRAARPCAALGGRQARACEGDNEAADQAILRRLDALALYARYVELYRAYDASRREARQPAFMAVLEHAYRMRTTSLVHAKALHRSLPKKDRTVAVPKEQKWSEALHAAPEIAAFVAGGLKTHAQADFHVTRFEEELVPLSATSSGAAQAITTRGELELSAVFADPAKPLALTVTSGMFGPERTLGKAYIELRRDGEKVASFDVPQDKKPHVVSLRAPKAGTYRIVIRENKRGASLEWPFGAPVAIVSGEGTPADFHGRWNGWFYVPRGTKVVGGYSGGVGFVRDASGRVLLELPVKPDHFRVEVPAGQDGKLWRFEKSAGIRLLMTVPPYLFRAQAEAIVPRSLSTKPGP
jgi:hypothetical protein